MIAWNAGLANYQSKIASSCNYRLNICRFAALINKYRPQIAGFAIYFRLKMQDSLQYWPESYFGQPDFTILHDSSPLSRTSYYYLCVFSSPSLEIHLSCWSVVFLADARNTPCSWGTCRMFLFLGVGCSMMGLGRLLRSLAHHLTPLVCLLLDLLAVFSHLKRAWRSTARASGAKNRWKCCWKAVQNKSSVKKWSEPCKIGQNNWPYASESCKNSCNYSIRFANPAIYACFAGFTCMIMHASMHVMHAYACMQAKLAFIRMHSIHMHACIAELCIACIVLPSIA